MSKNETPPNKRRIAPSVKKWPSYQMMHAALLLARVVAFLPWRMQLFLGAITGDLCYALLKRRRAVCACNIAHCFPELSEQQQRDLVRASFRANAIGLLEALRSWFRNPYSLAKRTRIEGLEYLDAARAKGKGVILLGAHYTTLDLAGSLTTMYFKADIMQRDHNHPVFNRFIRRSREGLYGKVLGKSDLRGLLRSLRKNHIVWYATDQDAGRTNAVFAPFFGVTASTLIAPMRLAKRSGAMVVPFSHFRLPGNQGYLLRIHAPLQDFPSGDDLHDATRLNAIIEANLKNHPEQYLWLHRRFKTPPEVGAMNIYGQYKDVHIKS